VQKPDLTYFTLATGLQLRCTLPIGGNSWELPSVFAIVICLGSRSLPAFLLCELDLALLFASRIQQGHFTKLGRRFGSAFVTRKRKYDVFRSLKSRDAYMV
jgi:hypothetical protein